MNELINLMPGQNDLLSLCDAIYVHTIWDHRSTLGLI